MPERVDPPLDVLDVRARLRLAKPCFVAAGSEPLALRTHRLETRLQLLDLLARAPFLVRDRVGRGAHADELGARRLRLGIRGGPRLVRRARLLERRTHVVLAHGHGTAERGVELLADARFAARGALERVGEARPLPLAFLDALALACRRLLGLDESRAEAVELGRPLRVEDGLVTRGLGALGGRRLEGAGELRPLALRLGERGEQRLDPLARLLRDRRGRGCRCGCGRRDDGGRGTRRRRRGRAAPLRRLDHADDLAERLDEGADVVLGDRPRRLRDEHEASQRGHAGVQRKTRDRANRRDRLDQRGHVPVPGRALDQVDAPVEKPVERHVPAERVAAPDAPEPPAALVGEAGLRRKPQDVVALVVEADGGRGGAGRFEDRCEGRVEHVLGRRRPPGDLPQPFRERRRLRGLRGRPADRRSEGRLHPMVAAAGARGARVLRRNIGSNADGLENASEVAVRTPRMAPRIGVRTILALTGIQRSECPHLRRLVGDMRKSKYGPMVLIVEEDEQIRDSLGDLLTERGCSAIGVATTVRALGLIAQGFRPRVILLDPFTPNGAKQFKVQLGANPAVASTPVIVGPGGLRNDPEMRPTLPHEHHLRGPLDVQELVRLVHGHCRSL